MVVVVVDDVVVGVDVVVVGVVGRIPQQRGKGAWTATAGRRMEEVGNVEVRLLWS